MTGFAERLARRIRVAGPVNVAEYMEEALAAYYGARDPLGAQGDFITAPEVSQIFGELIGLWCAELWQRLGGPDPFMLVELGPGRGTLMADALRAAQIVPGFVEAARLHLVERSEVLRTKQAATLGFARPCWHDDVAALPVGPMLLVANEFLDALPIRQFEHRGGAWHERRIGLAPDGIGFVFLLEPHPSPLTPQLPSASEGAIFELSLAARELGEALGTRLAAEGGAALFIDYGHDPSACGDTFQAVRRHHAHGVLDAPASADLTAHVDFGAFAASARAAGARVFGPVAQGEFLLRLGLEARAAALLRNATPTQAAAISSGCRRLCDPAEMGSLFKVIALGQEGAPAPSGFGQE